MDIMVSGKKYFFYYKRTFDRANRELQLGVNYFEIEIEIPADLQEICKFDKGEDSGLSLGIASSTFDVESCTSGWTAHNSGVGYYSGKYVRGYNKFLTI
jgi:hypothetical protein